MLHLFDISLRNYCELGLYYLQSIMPKFISQIVNIFFEE